MIRELIDAKRAEYIKAIAGAKSGKVARYLSREYKRWLCRNDLFFLTCITGHEKIAQWGDFYRPFCDDVSLMNWKVVELKIHPKSEGMLEVDFDIPMQRLYLKYRGYYKTTVVTICHTAQLLLNFNNIHVVLCHNKQRTSSDNLVAIKNLFLNRPKLSKETLEMVKREYGVWSGLTIADLFPECIPDGKEWGSAEKFSLANRTDKQRPEDNIEAVGVDTEITGGHWQVAKKNDLVTEKSVNTEDQIKKTLDWDSRFNKGHFDQLNQPLQDYEGTRYHHVDLYSLLKNNPQIKLSETTIIKDMDKFREGDDSQIAHPERYNRKDIEDLMNDMWVFMCQLMLRPEDPEKNQFNKGMIQYFDTIPEGCFNYLLIDPATAKKKKSDYTVMLVVSVIVINDKVCKFIRDGIRDKIDSKKRVDTAIELSKKYDVKGIGWEAIGFQETDCFYFEEKRRKEGLRTIATEIKSHATAKEDRIRGLIPEYASGEWYWPEKGKIVRKSQFSGKAYDLTEQLELELVDFPLSQHDDLFDAQTFLNRLDIQKPVLKEVLPEREGLTFGDYHKMCENSRKRRNNPWNVETVSHV